METIKSELTKNAIGGIIFVVLFYIPFIVFFLYFIRRDFFLEEFNIVGVFLLLFFVPLHLLIILQFNRIKYIVVESKKIKYYSIFSPFGKTFYFEDLAGKILIREKGRVETAKVVYLVDKRNRTVFKITETSYKNFDALIKSIPLKSIDFKPTIGQYWKLSAVERMSIEEKRGSKDINKMYDRMGLISLIVSIVGVIAVFLAILMAIIRNVTL